MTALNRRRALALMGSLIPAVAFGAGYPDRPVKLVVALAAGAVFSLGIAGWVLAGHGGHH